MKHAKAMSRTGLSTASLSGAAQILVGGGLLLAFLRLGAISQGDVGIAVAVLASTGYAAPVVASLLPIFSLLLPFAAVNVINYRWVCKLNGRSDELSRAAFPLAGSIMIVAFLLVSWVSLLAFPLLLLLFWVFYRLRLRRARRSKLSGSAAPVDVTTGLDVIMPAVIAILFSLIWQVTSPAAWLPLERLSLEGSSDSLYGYALEESGAWITVLEDRPRRLLKLPAASIAERAVCNRTTVTALPVLRVIDYQNVTPDERCSVRR